MMRLQQLLLESRALLREYLSFTTPTTGPTAANTFWQLIVVTTVSLLGILSLILAYLWYKRRATQRILEKAGLPTVFWTPRFVDYDSTTTTSTTNPYDHQSETHPTDDHEDKKLRSTSITRMLPRMERLKGPMGMYGTVYGVSTAVVHVAHPVAAKTILTQTETSGATATVKAPAYNHFFNFCGRGVFTAEGADWKAKRVSVLHALLRGNTNNNNNEKDGGLNSSFSSSSSSSSFEERVLEQAHLAANELMELMEHHSQQKQKQQKQSDSKQQQQQQQRPFNIVPLIQQCTVGLIFRYITHADIPDHAKHHQPKGNSSSTTNTKDDKSSLLKQYLQSVTTIRMIILAQSRSIWYLLPRWVYRTFANLYRQEEDTMISIRQFAHLACQHAKPNSPVQQLELSDSHQQGKRMLNSNTGKTISQDLLEEVITLLFAGQDTSAATLSWTLHLLTLYPDIQSKVAQEVQSVLGPSPEVQVTKAMINQMPYLDAVIKESMRLYPVAPFVVRKLSQDITISSSSSSKKKKDTTSADITLPKNAMACLWIYGLHHHPDYWKQPEDFLPERWLVTDPKKRDAGISNGAYMPFAVGSRNCLGQPLAHWILRSLLARILQRYQVEDARVLWNQNKNNCEVAWRKDMQAGFTVLPRGGVSLIVRERR